ncbi:MAG: hypothetical protein J3K34DRAFT_527308 [Monoraphidium minutum]|nr:MAG: hypothetical protein J3K34DRAFT_527308 [Monoraphidium minutum]
MSTAQRRQQQQRGAAAAAADPRLDFFSPAFDPLLALSTEGLAPPVPGAPPRERVGQYRDVVPPEARGGVGGGGRGGGGGGGGAEDSGDGGGEAEGGAAAAARAKAERARKAEALKRRAQQAAARAEAGAGVAPLDEVMGLVPASGGGPLSALHGWRAAGDRVLVVTRHAAGVRGQAAGRLVAFDRFLNLVLADVEETYTVITKVPRTTAGAAGDPPPPPPQQQQQQQQQEARGQQDVADEGRDPGGGGGGGRVRWCRKQEVRFRRLDLVMVKGDQIVLIAAGPGARTAAPGAGGGGKWAAGGGGGGGGGAGGGAVG